MYTAASQANQMIESLTEIEFSNKELQDAYLGRLIFFVHLHFFLFINYRNIPLIKELPKALMNISLRQHLKRLGILL